MSLFVIGDLHLALGDKSKSMDIFDGWENYTELLGQSWNSLVSAEDTIVLAGDISWAISLEKGYEDFNLKNRSCYKKKIYINTKDKKIFVFS